MAGMNTSEMEVREQLKDITECCVCSETYKDPKILPCIHTFCMKCLEEAGGKTGKGPGEQMPCPMCRKEFTIPEDGYAAIQKNFFMEKLIEMAKIASSSDGSGLCEACLEEENESASVGEIPLAEMYCNDCEQKLCQECSRHHRKNKLTRNHQVVAAVDSHSESKMQIPRPSICEKHEREHMLYCSECKELMCKSCFDESHQNHRLQNVRNTVEGFRNDIKDILSGLEVCMSQVLEKKENLNCEVEEYCEDLERLKLEVRAQADATMQLVSEHASLVMQDIDQLKVQKRKEVNGEIEESDGGLTCLESFKVYCAEVMTKGSVSDICCRIDELKERFEDIKKIHEWDIEIKTYLHKMTFQMSDMEEFVKTENYNIIGTIQEYQTDVDGKGQSKTTYDKFSHDGDIKTEENCRMVISRNNGILAKIIRFNQELENDHRRIRGLEMEKKALEKRINELILELDINRPMKSTSGFPMAQAAAQPSCKQQVPQPRISIDYKRSPNRVKTIQSGDERNIVGLTILDDELFVGYLIGDTDRSAVEAYDIKTFNFKRRWQVNHLSQSYTGVARIRCMASCTRHKYLYACVFTVVVGSVGYHVPVIQRTDVNGSIAKEWEIYGGIRVSNLSVTGEGNIIIITGSSLLNEYSRDGVLVHEMKLPCSLGIECPLHALKLANGNFVVSHGLGRNCLHRVLILSESGQIMKSFGEMRLPKVKQVPPVYEPKLLNEPAYLTVDGFGNILVSDRGNDRIVVLNSNLELESSINPTPPLKRPRYMCVDADRGRLLICEGLKKVSLFDFSLCFW